MKTNKTQRKTGYNRPSLPPPQTSNHDLNSQIQTPEETLAPAGIDSAPALSVQPHPNWVSPGQGQNQYGDEDLSSQ